VTGLWDGISSMGEWLWDQITGFAGGILEGFQDAFGIASPSKVMRDSVGKYLAEGLGVGFTDNIPEIGKAALDAFSNLQLPEIGMTAEISAPRGAHMPQIDGGAVRMLQNARDYTASDFVQPSPTSEIINNNYYSTTNNRTAGEQPVINVHVHCETEMDGEKVAEMVAEKVDILQGEAVTMDERGTAH
jgi:phage-related protein